MPKHLFQGFTFAKLFSNSLHSNWYFQFLHSLKRFIWVQKYKIGRFSTLFCRLLHLWLQEQPTSFSKDAQNLFWHFKSKKEIFSLMPKKIFFHIKVLLGKEKNFVPSRIYIFLGKKVHSHSRYKLSLICTFDKCNGRDPLTLILHSASWNFFSLHFIGKIHE